MPCLNIGHGSQSSGSKWDFTSNDNSKVEFYPQNEKILVNSF